MASRCTSTAGTTRRTASTSGGRHTCGTTPVGEARRPRGRADAQALPACCMGLGGLRGALRTGEHHLWWRAPPLLPAASSPAAGSTLSSTAASCAASWSTAVAGKGWEAGCKPAGVTHGPAGVVPTPLLTCRPGQSAAARTTCMPSSLPTPATPAAFACCAAATRCPRCGSDPG